MKEYLPNEDRPAFFTSGSEIGVNEGFYEQQVDHFGSQTGVNGSTFWQWYAVIDTFYKPGGPVLFYIQGESKADLGYLKYGIVPQLAETYNGLIVSLEHRFYGAPDRSTPTADLSNESLKLLSSRQAIEDIAQFITDFPNGYPEYKLDANTKWIAIGGSYPGSLAAWIRSKYPNLVYAAHASSAPVLSKLDFWEYSYAVYAGTATAASQACASGFTKAVAIFDYYITEYLQRNLPQHLRDFKSWFGYDSEMDTGEFAFRVTTVLASSIQYGKEFSYYYGKYGDKDAVSWLDAVCSGVYFPAFVDEEASVSALMWSLRNLTVVWEAKGDPRVMMNGDGGVSKSTAHALNERYRLWTHQFCYEFGYFQDATPDSIYMQERSMYSKYVDVDYNLRDCRAIFEDSNLYPDVNGTNAYYGGLNLTIPRILWVNGDVDPWHWLSNFNEPPGEEQTTILIKGGHHCSDLWGRTSSDSDYTTKVYDDIFKVYDKWLK
ncbi:Thymus-specific serine protease [Blyttiomyces sp. JEL0837]|nr:Thymus-specific serine protease [Blyttiomyces sp. JEL0837]